MSVLLYLNIPVLHKTKGTVVIVIRARFIKLCDKVCQWLATDRWFSPGPPVSSTNKTNCHDIAEILLKVALNTIQQTNKQTNKLPNPYYTIGNWRVH